jgi:hypothetical protein
MYMRIKLPSNEIAEDTDFLHTFKTDYGDLARQMENSVWKIVMDMTFRLLAVMIIHTTSPLL